MLKTQVIIQIKNYQKVLLRAVFGLLSFLFTTVNFLNKDDFLNPMYNNILKLSFSLCLKEINGFISYKVARKFFIL